MNTWRRKKWPSLNECMKYSGVVAQSKGGTSDAGGGSGTIQLGGSIIPCPWRSSSGASSSDITSGTATSGVLLRSSSTLVCAPTRLPRVLVPRLHHRQVAACESKRIGAAARMGCHHTTLLASLTPFTSKAFKDLHPCKSVKTEARKGLHACRLVEVQETHCLLTTLKLGGDS